MLDVLAQFGTYVVLGTLDYAGALGITLRWVLVALDSEWCLCDVKMPWRLVLGSALFWGLA
eukprot:5057702-Amphidinium_carterae.1